MSAAPQVMFLFPDMPPALRRRGSTVVGLILGPRSSIRRFIKRTRDGVEDVSACFSESRPIDLLRDDELDAALLALDAGDWREARRRLVNAKALDARIDPIVWGSGWSVTRLLAGYLNQALLARRTAGRASGGRR